MCEFLNSQEYIVLKNHNWVRIIFVKKSTTQNTTYIRKELITDKEEEASIRNHKKIGWSRAKRGVNWNWISYFWLPYWSTNSWHTWWFSLLENNQQHLKHRGSETSSNLWIFWHSIKYCHETDISEGSKGYLLRAYFQQTARNNCSKWKPYCCLFCSIKSAFSWSRVILQWLWTRQKGSRQQS